MEKKEKNRIKEITKIYNFLEKLQKTYNVTNLDNFCKDLDVNSTHQKVARELGYIKKCKEGFNKVVIGMSSNLFDASTHIERRVNVNYEQADYRKKLTKIYKEL
tara:strand:- start:3473 stop:3784 length:312 start_codon:yes stop_codon:yes gene_type:complete